MSDAQIAVGLLLMIVATLAFIRWAIHLESRDKRGPYSHMNSVTRVRNNHRGTSA